MSDSRTFEFVGGPHDGVTIELGETAYQFSFPMATPDPLKRKASYVYRRETGADKFTFSGITTIKL